MSRSIVPTMNDVVPLKMMSDLASLPDQVLLLKADDKSVLNGCIAGCDLFLGSCVTILNLLDGFSCNEFHAMAISNQLFEVPFLGKAAICVFSLNQRAFFAKQNGKNFSTYYGELTYIFGELDHRDKAVMTCAHDIEIYRKSIQRQRVHTFLVGLDVEFEQIHGEILRKYPTLELEATYALVRHWWDHNYDPTKKNSTAVVANTKNGENSNIGDKASALVATTGNIGKALNVSTLLQKSKMTTRIHRLDDENRRPTLTKKLSSSCFRMCFCRLWHIPERVLLLSPSIPNHIYEMDDCSNSGGASHVPIGDITGVAHATKPNIIKGTIIIGFIITRFIGITIFISSVNAFIVVRWHIAIG
ncbi:unnamed protein product [Prunus brigantina]